MPATSSTQFALVVALALSAVAVSADDMVLLKPPAGASGPQVGLIMIQGAQSPAKSYAPLYEKLQQLTANKYSLYVAIPAFYFSTPQPIQISSKISEAQKAMKSAGLGSDAPLFVAGHSLGTVFLQSWAFSNKASVAGQILMGGGLLRKYRNGTASTTFPVPTLTLDGTLDGLYRVLRQAETYYHYQEHAPVSTKADFPVVLFEGANHWSFASGPPPSNVKSNDLKAEMSEDDAHAAIAATIADFMAVRLAGHPGGFPSDASAAATSLSAAVADTGSIVAPLIAALEQEAHVHLKPACNSDYPMPASCPDYHRYPSGAQGTKPQTDCVCGTPWVSEQAQSILAGLDSSPAASSGASVVAVDAVHSVSDVTPVHLPHIWHNCTEQQEQGCTVNVTTVTQPIYSTLDSLDTGFYPASASELRVKLKSRQSVWLAAGVKDVNFTATDVVPSLCAQINAEAYKWALAHAGPVAAKRFASIGEPLTMGPDSFNGNAGPLWILNSLKYNQASDKSKIEVVAPCSHTPVDYSIAQAAGYHYCKLLSPARAMEHIYIDGLRQAKK